MKRQRTIGRALNLLAVLVVILPVTARSQGTITANPSAVDMLQRQLWRMEGRATGDFQYGGGIGGGIDVNGDGYGDFFVNFKAEGKWKLFYGGTKPDTIAEWVGGGSSNPSYPVIGNFYGEDRKMVGFGTRRKDTSNPDVTVFYYQMRFFIVDSGRVMDDPVMVYDPERTVRVSLGYCEGAQAVDCDGDGVADLAMEFSETVRNGQYSERPEVWFFRGGSGFQVDTPTVIVKDAEELNYYGYYVGLGDIDGDGRVDMVTAGQYRDGGKLKFYWGTEESPWSWTVPDRVVELGDGYPSIFGNVFPAMMDLDGDGIKDLVFQGGYVYRSGRRKTIQERRERSYRLEDADVELSGSKPFCGGYINDSTRTYEMLLMTGRNTGYWFSGGANGIDTTYEAYYRDGWSGGTIFAGHGESVGDIDGDGWDDYGACNPHYGNVQGSLNSGAAVIFRGGPELPGPDRVAGVRDVEMEGLADAVRAWPNPVDGELTIAWRGDLRRKPSRFEVVDVLGRRVASGEVEGWRGSAVWHCGEISPGVYVVEMFTGDGERLGGIRVVKR